jgi:hypothetical protein
MQATIFPVIQHPLITLDNPLYARTKQIFIPGPTTGDADGRDHWSAEMP